MIATCPGRSASQTTPSAIRATNQEHDDPDHAAIGSWFRLERSDRVVGKLARRGDAPARAPRALAIQAVRRRAHRGRQLAELGERAGKIAVRRLHVGAP